MSTDLQLLHDLPKPRTSSSAAIKIELLTDQNDRATLLATTENGRATAVAISRRRVAGRRRRRRAGFRKTRGVVQEEASERVSDVGEEGLVNKDEIDEFFRSNSGIEF